jgi:pimeloyl-ACP methyl ester carboxylesterase
MGEKDAEITAEMIADMKRFLPNLLFKQVAGAGHGIVLEKPDMVNEMVIEFLRGKSIANAASLVKSVSK